MNGHIILNTSIAVDYWNKSQKGGLVHFLSHMHSDHIRGLSSSWRRPIYCSEVSSHLLQEKFNLPLSLVHGLAIGQAHIINNSDKHNETFTVTLFDANHCPGSVMFYFEGHFGSIFYTGDFQYTQSMFSDLLLTSCKGVDLLYVDNTYNDPKHVFPNLCICEELVFDLIDRYQYDADIVIGLYNIGKEDLLVKIARKFQKWIVVDPVRLKFFRFLELPNVFTCERDKSNFLVVGRQQLTWRQMNEWQKKRKTVAIIPTAYTPDRMHVFKHPLVYSVPYTSHSSYPELLAFVRQLAPVRVLPVVGKQGKNAIADMKIFDGFLSSNFSTPGSRQTLEQCLEVSQQYSQASQQYSQASNSYTQAFNKEQCKRFSKKRKRNVKVSMKSIKSAKGVVFEDENESEFFKEQRVSEFPKEQRVYQKLSQNFHDNLQDSTFCKDVENYSINDNTQEPVREMEPSTVTILSDPASMRNYYMTESFKVKGNDKQSQKLFSKSCALNGLPDSRHDLEYSSLGHPILDCSRYDLSSSELENGNERQAGIDTSFCSSKEDEIKLINESELSNKTENKVVSNFHIDSSLQVITQHNKIKPAIHVNQTFHIETNEGKVMTPITETFAKRPTSTKEESSVTDPPNYPNSSVSSMILPKGTKRYPGVSLRSPSRSIGKHPISSQEHVSSLQEYSSSLKPFSSSKQPSSFLGRFPDSSPMHSNSSHRPTVGQPNTQRNYNMRILCSQAFDNFFKKIEKRSKEN